ncbi:hypothetical protein CEXT_772181 [Caerostris extrusa]|uniref:Uncharacterized protein n=1 Tax=Caerostris extrusa TaxID=172846 RepID=A0AAV4VHF1_CAEEX|nr:hypothetical protein CEXT_772181 [Caerostris extrusa]
MRLAPCKSSADDDSPFVAVHPGTSAPARLQGTKRGFRLAPIGRNHVPFWIHFVSDVLRELVGPRAALLALAKGASACRLQELPGFSVCVLHWHSGKYQTG